VDDIDAEIAAASFVVLPIRIASGTRTRILEAANLKTAVISTTIGAEGFAFSPQEIIIKDEAKAFAQAMLELMQDASRAAELGAKLLAKSHQLYLDDVVARNLIATIEGGSACTYSG
jgi:glycosyltransferase involved in cell wall biosynthesis